MLALYARWYADCCDKFERIDERIRGLEASLAWARLCGNPDLERRCTLGLVFGLKKARRIADVETTIKAALRRSANREDPRQVAILDGNLAMVLEGRRDLEAAEFAERSLSYFLSDLPRSEEDAATTASLLLDIYVATGGQKKAEAFVTRMKGALSGVGGLHAVRQTLSLNKAFAKWYEKLTMAAPDRDHLYRRLVAIVRENQTLALEHSEPDNDFDYMRWLTLAGELSEAERALAKRGEALANQDADRFVEETLRLAQAYEKESRVDDAARLFLQAADVALRFDSVTYKATLVTALLRHGEPELATMAARLPQNGDDREQPPTWKVHQRLAAAYDSDHELEAIREIDRARQNFNELDRAELLRLNLERRSRFISLIEKALVRDDHAEAWRLAETMTHSDTLFDTLTADAKGFFGKQSKRASVVCYYSLRSQILIVTFRPATDEVCAHTVEPTTVVSQSLFGLYDQIFNAMLKVFRQIEDLNESFNLGQVDPNGYMHLGKDLDDKLNDLLARPETDKYLAILYDNLILPVEEEFGSGRLVALVVDSLLASVPFYALHDSRRGDDLIDRGADLFFLPSLAHLREATPRRKAQLARTGLLIVPEPALLKARRRGLLSGSTMRVQVEGLAEESKEVEAVRSFGEVRVLAAQEASLQNIAEAMPQVGFVHVLSHGITNFESPEDAAIILAEGEQLRGLFLQRCVGELLWMVVLGSCYSASYRDSYTGETGTSLALDFIRHGVSLVIGSLWFVDTYATEIIMSNFYRGLAQEIERGDEADPNVAGVLRRALLEVRRRFPHVYYWGLFYPLGDFCPRALQTRSSKTNLNSTP